METQYSTPAGRLDIVVLFDHEPVIIIESKIRSPIGKRADTADQLAAYGLWLRSQADSAGRSLAVLCLLTHLTEPPDKFTEMSLDLYGSTPSVLRWSELAKWLEASKRDIRLNQDIRTLGNELYTFLEEQDMTTEAPHLEDFAAAIVYVKAGTRIASAYEEIFDHLSSLDGIFSTGSVLADLPLHFDSEQNLIQGWKYLSALPLRSAYFAYGIALQPKRSLQPEGILAQDRLPAEDSLFISLGVDNRREMRLLEEHAGKAGQSWQYLPFGDGSILASFRPLKTILAEPESFSNTMRNWIDEAFPNIVAVVTAMRQQSAT
jgi:hypothetical protein